MNQYCLESNDSFTTFQLRHLVQVTKFQFALMSAPLPSNMSLCARLLSHVLCSVKHAQTVAHQDPLSSGAPRQDYWIGFPFATPGDLPDLGIKLPSLASAALAGRSRLSTAEPPGKSLSSNSFGSDASHSSCSCLFFPFCLIQIPTITVTYQLVSSQSFTFSSPFPILPQMQDSGRFLKLRSYLSSPPSLLKISQQLLR